MNHEIIDGLQAPPSYQNPSSSTTYPSSTGILSTQDEQAAKALRASFLQLEHLHNNNYSDAAWQLRKDIRKQVMELVQDNKLSQYHVEVLLSPSAQESDDNSHPFSWGDQVATAIDESDPLFQQQHSGTLLAAATDQEGMLSGRAAEYGDIRESYALENARNAFWQTVTCSSHITSHQLGAMIGDNNSSQINTSYVLAAANSPKASPNQITKAIDQAERVSALPNLLWQLLKPAKFPAQVKLAALNNPAHTQEHIQRILSGMYDGQKTRLLSPSRLSQNIKTISKKITKRDIHYRNSNWSRGDFCKACDILSQSNQVNPDQASILLKCINEKNIPNANDRARMRLNIARRENVVAALSPDDIDHLVGKLEEQIRNINPIMSEQDRNRQNSGFDYLTKLKIIARHKREYPGASINIRTITNGTASENGEQKLSCYSIGIVKGAGKPGDDARRLGLLELVEEIDGRKIHHYAIATRSQIRLAEQKIQALENLDSRRTFSMARLEVDIENFDKGRGEPARGKVFGYPSADSRHISLPSHQEVKLESEHTQQSRSRR